MASSGITENDEYLSENNMIQDQNSNQLNAPNPMLNQQNSPNLMHFQPSGINPMNNMNNQKMNMVQGGMQNNIQFNPNMGNQNNMNYNFQNQNNNIIMQNNMQFNNQMQNNNMRMPNNMQFKSKRKKFYIFISLYRSFFHFDNNIT